jgi:hypothetical protein
MKEQLITFDTAVLAKEKGFDLDVCCFYDVDGIHKDYHLTFRNYNGIKWSGSENHIDIGKKVNFYSAPSQSILQRWIRENFHLHITIFSSSQESWMFKITKLHESLSQHDENDKSYGEDFNSYEDALEQGLKNSLEKIS